MAEEAFLKLFIGGFKCETTQKEISNFFEKKGPCKIELKMKRKSKKISLGYCYLRTKDQKMYHQLLNKGKVQFEDRMVEIKPYLKGEDLDSFYEAYNARRVQVYNLPEKISNDQLKDFFSKYGLVENAYTIHDFRCMQGRNNGFVLFTDRKSAANVDQIKNFIMDGCEVKARLFSKDAGLDKSLASKSGPLKSESSHESRPSFIGKKRPKSKNKISPSDVFWERKNFNREEADFVKKIDLESPIHLLRNRERTSPSSNYQEMMYSYDLSWIDDSKGTRRPESKHKQFGVDLVAKRRSLLHYNSMKEDQIDEENRDPYNRLESFPKSKKQDIECPNTSRSHRIQCIRLDTFGEREGQNEMLQPLIEESEEEIIETSKQKECLNHFIVVNHDLKPTMELYHDCRRNDVFDANHDRSNLRINLVSDND